MSQEDLAFNDFNDKNLVYCSIADCSQVFESKSSLREHIRSSHQGSAVVVFPSGKCLS